LESNDGGATTEYTEESESLSHRVLGSQIRQQSMAETMLGGSFLFRDFRVFRGS